MKVRKLLRDNQNAVISITVWDGAEYYTFPSKSPMLEEYMHREVLGWRISSASDMCNPAIVIDLKKEVDNEARD